MSRVPITKEGEVFLKEELSKLKFVERPKISEAIAEARDRKSTRLNSSHVRTSRMPSSA